MNNKKLTVLAIIAIITSALAIWTSTNKQSPAGDPTKPRYLIGNIEPSLINEIQIGTGSNTVTMKRSGKQFVIKNKDDYPAKTTEINDIMRTCIDIQISELYTEDATNHKALGVTEEDSTSQVKFIKADGSLLTGVIIGKTKESGRGTYIRQPENDKVYVTLGNPQIRSNAMDYVDHEITPVISKESIESVTVTQAGDRYELTVNDQGKIVPDQMQEGMTLKDAETEKVFTAISSLRFTDVSKDTQSLSFNKSFICKLTDETVYTLFLLEKDDKTYLTCNATYQGQLPKQVRNLATPEELKDKEAKYLARDNAIEFMNKHNKWIYEISPAAAQNLTKPLNDLFEKPEPPEQKSEMQTPEE